MEPITTEVRYGSQAIRITHREDREDWFGVTTVVLYDVTYEVNPQFVERGRFAVEGALLARLAIRIVQPVLQRAAEKILPTFFDEQQTPPGQAPNLLAMLLGR